MDKILIHGLKSGIDDFSKNELAYLSLTSKIELPFRDKWAFALHQLLSDEFTVSREWRRTDLAILDSGKPKALIELKAMYSFDAALYQEDLHGYFQAMKNDEIKAEKLTQKLSLGSTNIYTVLLVCHPKTEIPITLEKIVKYRTGINRAIKKCSGSPNVKNKAIEAIDQKFKDKNVICKGEARGGKAFGISSEILYWIIKSAA